MKEDWTKHFARLAAKHRSQAPDGLLDDVRREMERRGLSVEKPQQGKTVPMWGYRRTAVAVAATALALAIPFTWKALQDRSDTQTQIASENSPAKADRQNLRQSGTPTVSSTAGHGLLASAANRQTTSSTTITAGNELAAARTSAATPNVASATPNVTSAVSNEPVSTATTEKDGHEAPAATAQKPPTAQKQHRPTTNYSYGNSYETNDLAMNQQHGSPLSLGVFYGAGSSHGNLGNAEVGMMSDPVFDSNDYAMVLGYAKEPIKTEAHHNMPIKAGVSLSYRLSPRWSVQTGLAYSYLSSNITTSYINHTEELKQRLHYIGVPLTASYTVIGNDHWTAYLTAGGMVEKLVKGQTKDSNTDEVSDISEHRLQWSVKAAVGAAYHVSQLISVYVEPGVSHYFDNHSGVVNVYKDRPTTFTLDMGLRLDLNR